MKFIYNTAVTVGPALLLLSLILMPVYFLSWRSAPQPKRHLSGWIYTFLCLISAIPAFIAGMAAGIWLACSSPDSSNLCGLLGVFGTGPLVAGAAIWCCAYFLTRYAKRAP